MRIPRAIGGATDLIMCADPLFMPNPSSPKSLVATTMMWIGGAGLIDQLGEAVGPDVDGVGDECVGPGIELVSGDEEMKRTDGDALDGQAAATAMFW